jgi:hypothetical protein
VVGSILTQILALTEQGCASQYLRTSYRAVLKDYNGLILRRTKRESLWFSQIVRSRGVGNLLPPLLLGTSVGNPQSRIGQNSNLLAEMNQQTGTLLAFKIIEGACSDS